MLAQSAVERELYEARRKFQVDYQTSMKVAREEGRLEGQIEGRIAMIHLCQQLLHRPTTPAEQLLTLPFDELCRLADALQSEVQQR